MDQIVTGFWNIIYFIAIFFKFFKHLYQGCRSVQADGIVLIDGQPSTEYTFSQNYYWMMGDNRHGSADSRFWGFVPEDHVSGCATFTWFSRQNEQQHGEAKIRWNRMFKMVR